MEKFNHSYINNPIKIALIGCGRISQKHLRAIDLQGSNAKLSVICDTNQERINKAKEFINNEFKDHKQVIKDLKIFNDFNKLIESVKQGLIEIDLVVLTTPSGLHPIQTIMAANSGINVCTEKPMATSWEDGISMVKTCDENKVKLFVVKQNRFNPTLQLLKRQIDKGRFGRINLVTVNVFWQRPQSYYDQDKWRGTWELDGGALMNQASHYVDLLIWLIGPVETISAETSTLGRNIEVEDTAAISLKWENGALGTLAVTMLTYPKNIEGSVTILGEKGTVKVGGISVNQIEKWDFEDKNNDDKLVDQVSYNSCKVYGEGHIPYYKNIIDTLKGQAKPMSDGNTGLKSLELLVASYESAETGKKIKIPLENNFNKKKEI